VALSDILFVGRLVPSKNLELLIEAVDLLVGKGLSPRVIVVGDGPQKKTWQDLVDHLGLNDCIEFVDAVKTESDVAALLESTRVLAAPSVREGFGMIVLEALAHGVPVVTVDHPRNAARHLVHHGVTGLVVPPMPGPFADALELLQEDQGLREKMAREAMDVARGATWDASLESTEAVYEARVA
jgi:glycosyltransferase involved in cell wall biosynthesis